MNFSPNSLYCGDCLDVMQQWPDGCIDLCYLDPPFNSKANYNILFGRDQGQLLLDKKLAQFVAFEDTWRWDDAAQDRVDSIELALAHPAHRVVKALRIALGNCGMLAYLSYMAERLVEIHRVLKGTGSVFLHCDPTASHYLKLVMDGLFGNGFRNEIVWCYAGGGQSKRGFPKKHDIILWYSKSPKTWLFDPEAVRVPYDSEYKSTVFAGDDTRAPGKTYGPNPDGKVVEDWWRGIPRPYGKDRLGYPTQKPLALLERIIKASSNEGDVVLDPFCGCGTTVAASTKLNRRFVGIDISHFAIDIVRERRLKNKAIPVNGFPVDIASAEMLAREAPFEFEKWAITRIPGMVPNKLQVGDGGIDGRGKILGDGSLVLAQVKGGRNVSLGHVRDFRHVLAREDAACGIFATLRPLTSRKAKAEATGAGHLEIGANRYPKAQFWSIADYFQNRLPVLPPLADPYTGKAMEYDMFAHQTAINT